MVWAAKINENDKQTNGFCGLILKIMFTGIIETTATVKEISRSGTNKSFWIASPLSAQFKIDQSIARYSATLANRKAV